MSLNSLSQAMPAIQSALPSRVGTRASTSTAVGSSVPGRSISGSSSSSLRTARLLAAERQQQLTSGSSPSTSIEPAIGPDFGPSRVAPSTARSRAAIYANPPTAFFYGVPVTILAATCISLGLNLVSIILLATANCSFGLYQVRHLLGFLVLAQVALGSMLLYNIFYHRYNYNCLSLTLSFMFSGSAALLIFSLFETLVSGLCMPPGTPTGSVLASKYPANYAVWFMTVISVASQMAAHYYYG